MSIVFREADESICKRLASPGSSRFVWATIDPATKHQLNLPADYKYHSVLLHRKYADLAERFQNFKVRADDIWIIGHPKSGTNWLHNIAWQLKNHLKLTKLPLNVNEDFFENSIMLDVTNDNEKLKMVMDERDKSFLELDSMPSPRIIKSHLPPFLLPKEIWTVKPKIIHIVRNPKDIIVSRYYMFRNNAVHYTGTLETLCTDFINGISLYGPFFDHVFSYWQLRHLDHLLFVHYEELCADLFNGIQRISEFLGCSYTNDQLKSLTEYVSFENMRSHCKDNSPAAAVGGKLDPNYRFELR